MGNTKKTATAEVVLPPDIEDALADALAPVEPAGERAAALRARVLERVHGEARPFVTVRSSEGNWQTLAPKVAIKMLDDDGRMQAFLIRLDPGGRIPGHHHSVDEQCVVLEGSVRLGDVEAGAGDYHVALAGSTHGDIVSETGALLFLRTRSGTIPHRPTR